MSRFTSEAAELRAVRREIAISIAMLLVSGLVVYNSSRAGFRSTMYFPHVFAVLISLAALWSLRTARRVAWKVRVPLAIAVIVVAASAPFVHERAFVEFLQARERRGMEALGGGQAPAIPYLRAIGAGDERSGELTVGGRVTLVNFWATWCGPCVEELPVLQAFWSEHLDDGVDVLGVTKIYGDPEDVEAELDSVRRFLADHGVRYPTLIAGPDSPAHRAYRVESLPSSILIDRSGQVVGYGAGVAGTIRLMNRARALVGAESSVPGSTPRAAQGTWSNQEPSLYHLACSSSSRPTISIAER